MSSLSGNYLREGDQWDVIYVYKYQIGCIEGKVRLLSDRTRGNRHKKKYRKTYSCIKNNIFVVVV